MTQKRKFKEVAQKLGKRTMLAIIAMLIVGAVNAQKPKLAVMDFMAGVGLYQNDVNGLSDMLINSLFNTGRFELIERGQLCELINETNLQKSSLSAGQLQQLAIKGVNFLLLGTVNLTGGEFNIDVRVVDVGTGQLHSTAGVTKLSGQTYRDMMPKLANELAAKLPQTVNATVTVIPVALKKYSNRELESRGFIFRTNSSDIDIKKCEILNGNTSYGLVLFSRPSYNSNSGIIPRYYYLAFFIDGKYAYPILQIRDGDPNIGVFEGDRSYYFAGIGDNGYWNDGYRMGSQLGEVYGNHISSAVFIRNFSKGVVDLELLENNFNKFISSGKSLNW